MELPKFYKNLFATHLNFLLSFGVIVVIILFGQAGVPKFLGDWDKCTKEQQWTCYGTMDRNKCKCDCYNGYFDSLWIDKLKTDRSFKFIYFNMEWTTLLLVGWISFYILCFTRAVQYATKLFFSGQGLNWFAFIVWCSVVHPNYYSAGAQYIYTNDQYNHLTWHQWYFTITEFVIAWTLVQFFETLNNNKSSYLPTYLRTILLWVIFYVSMTHLIQATKDQGFEHIILGLFTTRISILLRDMALFITDVPSLIFAAYNLSFYANFKFAIKKYILRSTEQSSTITEESFKSFRNALLLCTSLVLLSVFFLSTITFGG